MKFSIYNNIVRNSDKVYIYNAWTLTTLLLETEKDIDDFEKLLSEKTLSSKKQLVKKLYKAGFIVDSKIDEYKRANKAIQKYYKNLNSLQIFIYVTNKCNFRCVYCPQEHLPLVFSSEKWDALYKFIFNHVDTKLCNSININFFGGEPLLEKKAIIKFLKKLIMLKYLKPYLQLQHSITTNGYLLTPKVYDELVCLGINSYQITVDGMENNHDKFRVKADGKGTWKKIIKNIEYINSKNDDVHINLRSNVNAQNYKSFVKFYDWFINKFNNQKFVLAIEPITEFNENVQKDLTWDKHEKEYTDFLQSINNKYNRTIDNLNNKLRWYLSVVCPSSYSNRFVIDVSGNIYKCEVLDYKQAKPVGYLDKTGKIIYTAPMEIYKNYESDDCKSCSIYPLCAGRRCPMRWAENHKNRWDCLMNNGEYESLMNDNIEKSNVIRIKNL